MKKFCLFFVFVLIFAFSCVSACFAASKSDVSSVLNNNQGGVMSIAYRGDTSVYPKNSLEGILSAAKKGADMISVSVQKTSDNVLVLCESGDLSAFCSTDELSVSSLTFSEFKKLNLLYNDSTVSSYNPVSLEETIKKLKSKAILVLDNAWELRNEIASFCNDNGCSSQIIIRTDVSSKIIAEWKSQAQSEISVFGIYSSNIVFNARSHLKRLSEIGMSAVQFQSKNYFNVVYNNFTAKLYSSGSNARAIAPMYDKDLCGQREDNVSGWDEMIGLGFSIIETNNIEQFSSYKEQINQAKADLKALAENLSETQLSQFSQVSVKNFQAAKAAADSCLENGNSSLGNLQSARSNLIEAMNNLTFAKQNDTQKGALNITGGKIASAVIFGALLLLGEVYVFKMRKPKEG